MNETALGMPMKSKTSFTKQLYYKCNYSIYQVNTLVFSQENVYIGIKMKFDTSVAYNIV